MALLDREFRFLLADPELLDSKEKLAHFRAK
jgi:hypothetical protein